MLTHSGSLAGIVASKTPSDPSTPPRRAAPLPPDERRRALVDAAIPLIADHGAAVTTKQLADAAGVSEGTIFNVFDDKSALIDAVVDAVTDPEATRQAIADIDAALSFPDQLIVATTLLQRRTRDVWRLLSKLVEQRPTKRGPMSEDPALVELMSAHRDELAVEPEDAARTLQALVLALSHPMITPHVMTPEVIVHRFLHGCANPEESA